MFFSSFLLSCSYSFLLGSYNSWNFISMISHLYFFPYVRNFPVEFVDFPSRKRRNDPREKASSGKFSLAPKQTNTHARTRTK